MGEIVYSLVYVVSARYIEISMVNTYLWINATAISSKKSKKRITDVWFTIEIDMLVKVSRMWPAVMFAHSRTDRVTGRIICLIDSINTINWDNARGVESGTRCLKNWLVLCVILKMIVLIQNGSARAKVNIICLEIVYTYGMRPQIFKIKIKRKVLISMKVFIFGLVLLNDVLSSEYI